MTVLMINFVHLSYFSKEAFIMKDTLSMRNKKNNHKENQQFIIDCLMVPLKTLPRSGAGSIVVPVEIFGKGIFTDIADTRLILNLCP